MTTIRFGLAAASSMAATDDLAAGPLESARLFDDSAHALRAGAPHTGDASAWAHPVDARRDIRSLGAAASDDVVVASAMDPAKTLGAAKDVEQSQDSDDTREAADQEEEDATKAEQTAKDVDTQ